MIGLLCDVLKMTDYLQFTNISSANKFAILFLMTKCTRVLFVKMFY